MLVGEYKNYLFCGNHDISANTVVVYLGARGNAREDMEETLKRIPYRKRHYTVDVMPCDWKILQANGSASFSMSEDSIQTS